MAVQEEEAGVHEVESNCGGTFVCSEAMGSCRQFIDADVAK